MPSGRGLDHAGGWHALTSEEMERPKPGSQACGTYLERTAQMIQELVALCGEEPLTVLREKYSREKAEHEAAAARLVGAWVTVTRRSRHKVDAKLDAAKKRRAQHGEEQPRARAMARAATASGAAPAGSEGQDPPAKGDSRMPSCRGPNHGEGGGHVDWKRREILRQGSRPCVPTHDVRGSGPRSRE